jgi:hypothetical protein
MTDYNQGEFERAASFSLTSSNFKCSQTTVYPAEPVTALQMARVKRSPSSPPPLPAHRPSLSSRSVDPTATHLGSKSTPRHRAVHPHDDQQDELDCLPAVVETSSPARPTKVPNKLHTPSASPHSRSAVQPTATSRRNNDLLDVPDGPRTREGRTSPGRHRHAGGGDPGSAARRNSERYSYAETGESAVTSRRTPAKRSRPGEQYPAPSASPSRSPSRSALSPKRSAAAGEGSTPTSSARKRSRRASSGLTFKPPAPSALTEDRDFRAAQRARLQEQRMRALAKRRRVEQVDEDVDDEEQEECGVDSDVTSADEEEGRRPQNGRRRAADRRTQGVATAERSTKSGHARAPTQQTSKPSPRPPRAPKRIKPDPDETIQLIASSASRPSDGPSPAQPVAPPPPPSATTTAPPPLRRYPTPPTASAFLTSLPLPSLARLAPHFHELGCTSPGELLVLCDPAQRPLRDEFLKEVADKAGGVSALERMMLHREMDCGWRKWTGAVDSSSGGGGGGEDGVGGR